MICEFTSIVKLILFYFKMLEIKIYIHIVLQYNEMNITQNLYPAQEAKRNILEALILSPDFITCVSK